MDDAALFEFAQGSALNALDRAEHLLALVEATPEPEVHFAAQLDPGMFDCLTQLRTVVIFALRTCLPPIGRDWSLAAKGKGAAVLRAQIAGARAELQALTAADFAGAAARDVIHRAGDATLTQDGVTYVRDFAIPNLWFHLSMAYAILRARGVEIGKADFDGLHAYERGFSFLGDGR